MRPRSVARAYIAGLFLAALPYVATPAGAEIRVRHDFGDESLRRDVAAVCTDVAGLIAGRMRKPPALGVKPFVIQQAADNLPRAVLNGLPKEYIVNITCLPSRDYCRITYQLAHELGHHYVNPYRSNWFIESTVTALSLIALSDMGDKWADNPPFPNWKSWAHHFKEYRNQTLRNMLEQIHLSPDEAQITTWLRAKAPALLQQGAFDRPQQHACAVVIEAVLKRHPKSWGALTMLGNATSASGQTDFKQWEQLVNPEERPLVKELAGIFSPLMNYQPGKKGNQ